MTTKERLEELGNFNVREGNVNGRTGHFYSMIRVIDGVEKTETHFTFSLRKDELLNGAKVDGFYVDNLIFLPND